MIIDFEIIDREDGGCVNYTIIDEELLFQKGNSSWCKVEDKELVREVLANSNASKPFLLVNGDMCIIKEKLL
jgi:hypothetical protein